MILGEYCHECRRYHKEGEAHSPTWLVYEGQDRQFPTRVRGEDPEDVAEEWLRRQVEDEAEYGHVDGDAVVLVVCREDRPTRNYKITVSAETTIEFSAEILERG